MREGLAAVLEVLGRKRRDMSELREAVYLFRAVAENTRGNVRSPEEDDLLYNLSGALLELAKLVGEEERQTMTEELDRILERAEAAFRQAGNVEQLTEVRARRGDVDRLRNRRGRE